MVNIKLPFISSGWGSIKSVPVIVLMPVNIWLAVCSSETVMAVVFG